jgi:hypothetical protein
VLLLALQDQQQLLLLLLVLQQQSLLLGLLLLQGRSSGRCAACEQLQQVANAAPTPIWLLTRATRTYPRDTCSQENPDGSAACGDQVG